jgi:uncharacterized protein
MEHQLTTDKVGLGWRVELSAEIGRNIDMAGDIEFLEVIAENYFEAPEPQVQGLAALARIVPMSMHGVSLGLASTLPLNLKVVDHMARLCEKVRPAFWSEHMCFVRGGGSEIGHLAAPPRTAATADCALENARTAGRIVGAAPVLENIATLLQPPCSTMGETEWLGCIVGQADGGMLLDLHNLYANARNFGCDHFEMMAELPLHLVKQIHLSGGVMIPAPGKSQRLLDDHIHDVADACYDMLEELAARVDQPLCVVIERDGRYPPMEHLVEQIRRARHALDTGRRRRRADGETTERRTEHAIN